ncbi:GDSL esterase/lipase At5g03610-like [Phragmites australis]|uniref:GDSL esterase/lipase At5g03610-like n=1 Tax=Phragmites australis TaxID=29695 RepID=UPI002D77DADB|nr:GDSL esterase/lipase At5g03610-like [Phragmites australis]
MKLLFSICFLFFLLHATHVESRRRHSDQRSFKLFVFGDSFADNGNLKKDELSKTTRDWYYPYGISDSDHDNQPTGRFSDGLVQSDFIAKILGQDESPPAERLRDKNVDLFGMNFAVGWAGVNDEHEPKLGTQIDKFRRLVRHGIIEKDLSDSVALVAISGFDYSDIPDENTDYDNFVDFIASVTDEIAHGVKRIQELGVSKVLVNMLHPMGCTPWYSRSNNYTKCLSEPVAEIHNKYLKHKLRSVESVLLLDLNTIFKDIIVPKTEKLFEHRHTPCCESFDESGYCGQYDEDGNPQFWTCTNPEKYFYWDEWHPTQAGWKAVMEQLEGSIKDFLEISS